MAKRTLSRIAKNMHKGALRRKAARAGESTTEFAREHKHDSGRTGAQARLAMTFAKHRPKKRPSKRGTGRTRRA